MSKGAQDKPLTFEGDWDTTVTYLPRHVVRAFGGVYMATATNTGTPPPDDTVWLALGTPVLYESNAAGGPPTNGAPFWYVEDETC